MTQYIRKIGTVEYFVKKHILFCRLQTYSFYSFGYLFIEYSVWCVLFLKTKGCYIITIEKILDTTLKVEALFVIKIIMYIFQHSFNLTQWFTFFGIHTSCHHEITQFDFLFWKVVILPTYQSKGKDRVL